MAQHVYKFLAWRKKFGPAKLFWNLWKDKAFMILNIKMATPYPKLLHFWHMLYQRNWADDLPFVIDEVFLYDKGPK